MVRRSTDPVLNASHCALTKWPSCIGALTHLKALVLSHNELSVLPSAFPYLPELNTLVLSHNQLSALPPTLPSSVPGLKKLSVSHNCLSSEGIPDFSVCSHLREVRLNSNAGVGVLPAHVSTWGRGVDGGAPGLVLLDVSECGLQDWMGLQPLLAHRARDTERHGLVNLCVKGNKVAAEPNYRDRLCASIPSLRILDQVRLQPKAQDDAPPASAAVEAIEQRRDDHAAAPSSTKGRKAGRREQAAKRDRPSEEAGETPVHKEWQAPGAGDAPASKKRKRSGRGPKKSRAAAEPASPEPAAARLASAAESPHEPVAERRASSAAAELPASSHDRVSRKKTRRKKGHKQIEMDMGTSTQGAVSEARRASPEPPARSSDAPPSGVFQVQEHRSHTPRVPVSLGRADVELDGW